MVPFVKTDTAWSLYVCLIATHLLVGVFSQVCQWWLKIPFNVSSSLSICQYMHTLFVSYFFNKKFSPCHEENVWLWSKYFTREYHYAADTYGPALLGERCFFCSETDWHVKNHIYIYVYCRNAWLHARQIALMCGASASHTQKRRLPRELSEKVRSIPCTLYKVGKRNPKRICL
jgi:hypothetical protein